MTNNIKFMLLGIFLAVMSVGGFVLADEEEIFLIIAIALPIAAVWAFVKGFNGCDKDNKSGGTEEKTVLLTQAQPTVSEQTE